LSSEHHKEHEKEANNFKDISVLDLTISD